MGVESWTAWQELQFGIFRFSIALLVPEIQSYRGGALWPERFFFIIKAYWINVESRDRQSLCRSKNILLKALEQKLITDSVLYMKEIWNFRK